MKKFYLTVAVALTVAASLTFSSCIGSFALTNKVMAWNKEIGNKFVNELVFIAFWILPVYEVTGIADLLVINSIEFWSGDNPLAMGTRAIDTESGRYLVECDGHGYTITDEATGHATRMDFESDTQTWSVINDEGESIPFMTFVDDTHVRMLTPDGNFSTVELSQQGVMAYTQSVTGAMLANK